MSIHIYIYTYIYMYICIHYFYIDTMDVATFMEALLKATTTRAAGIMLSLSLRVAMTRQACRGMFC